MEAEKIAKPIREMIADVSKEIFEAFLEVQLAHHRFTEAIKKPMDRLNVAQGKLAALSALIDAKI